MPGKKPKKVSKYIRMDEDLNARIKRIAEEYQLAESDLMRLGTVYLMDDIENKVISLDKVYRDAHTT